MNTLFPKTIGMKLDDLLCSYYELLPVPKQKPRPVQDEQDVENLLCDLFEAIDHAKLALGAAQDSFEYQDSKDSFERSLGAVERRVREAIEKSALKRTEVPSYHGGNSVTLR